MVGRKNTPESKGKYWCVVPGCNSDSRKKNKLDKYPWMEDVSFEPFPTKRKEPKLRAKWITMIRRPKECEPLAHHRVCTKHFVGNCRSENHTIPELFPWNNYKSVSTTKPLSIEKRERAMEQSATAPAFQDKENSDPAHMLQVSSSSQQHVPVDISVGLPFAVYETVVESCKLSESGAFFCNLKKPLVTK
ncbi:THAP domain-containing protein 11-like [Saccostrea cucullata]|uniref:THAP domain-containing protein 11-like n=1 Tax=Saccostrea cuccullata TaxID=36930 RepID=UPI002ED3160C